MLPCRVLDGEVSTLDTFLRGWCVFNHSNVPKQRNINTFCLSRLLCRYYFVCHPYLGPISNPSFVLLILHQGYHLSAKSQKSIKPSNPCFWPVSRCLSKHLLQNVWRRAMVFGLVKVSKQIEHVTCLRFFRSNFITNSREKHSPVLLEIPLL